MPFTFGCWQTIRNYIHVIKYEHVYLMMMMMKFMFNVAAICLPVLHCV